MRYITLFLSVLGLSVLCASAPIDSTAASTETTSNSETTTETSSDSVAPVEDDADDAFVYQWR
ncbi:hypothetical protein F4804DRAFT_323674 [Jackrogersella minutella]|nr:hypothetical protein F4804DRAFT_323674 [Jackrogersella minutella]